jgi:hypothetical protein
MKIKLIAVKKYISFAGVVKAQLFPHLKSSFLCDITPYSPLKTAEVLEGSVASYFRVEE